jgi:parvulin-like peptidyl-prolyl isomerase
MKRFLLYSVCLFLVAFSFSACKDSKDGKPKKADQDEKDQLFRQAGDLAASHILISFKGAQLATTQQTKEQALKRAKEIIAELQKDPSKFENIAMKESSDKGSAKRGGDLGTWPYGQMVPDFEVAVRQAKVGKLIDHPVESPYGFHIIRRNSLRTKFVGGEAFIISYKGLPQVPPTITRDKNGALALAAKINRELTPANFEEMAKKYNDLGKGITPVPPFTKYDESTPKGTMELLESLKYGEVGGPIEFPVGYAFFRRKKMELARASHIFIGYKGAQGVPPTVTRTKEQAQALASQLSQQLNADPSKFNALVTANSDDAQSKTAGGSLGVWFLGNGNTTIDPAVKQLKPNQIVSAPIETPFGFHILRREPLPPEAYQD